MSAFRIAIFSFTVFALALAPSARASTIWYVDGVNGSDGNNCLLPNIACKTIGHAISLASGGDTIRVAPATYKENLTIGISLNIVGANGSMTIVDGNQSGTVFNILAGAVLLSKLTVQNGTPSSFAAGIENDNAATLTVNKCTIKGNSASSAYAGGIANFGTLTVSNSTITGNSGSYGGGIVNFSTTTVSSSTITGNSGSYSGGIVNFSGTVALQNTIVANNPRGNCYLTVTSEGYNLSDDNTCNLNGPGDMNNTNPVLGTLGNHGGPTQTIPLLAGSPAFDGGNPNGCTDGHGNLLTTDQRGAPRPVHGCDIGAFQWQGRGTAAQ